MSPKDGNNKKQICYTSYMCCSYTDIEKSKSGIAMFLDLYDKSFRNIAEKQLVSELAS